MKLTVLGRAWYTTRQITLNANTRRRRSCRVMSIWVTIVEQMVDEKSEVQGAPRKLICAFRQATQFRREVLPLT